MSRMSVVDRILSAQQAKKISSIAAAMPLY